MTSSKFLLAVFSLVSLSSVFYAQSDSLYIRNQFQFYLYGGYSFSYVHPFIKNSDLRWHTDFSLVNNEENNDGNEKENYQLNTSPEFHTNQSSGKDTKNETSINLSIGVDFLYYPVRNEKLSFFWGGGPCLKYEIFSSKQTLKNYSQQGSFSESETEITDKRKGFGINGVLGIAAKLTETIAIIAEYGVAISYLWTKYDYTNESDSEYSKTIRGNTKNGDAWKYEVKSLKLGISYSF